MQPCTNMTCVQVENQVSARGAGSTFGSTRVICVSAWHGCQHVVVELQHSPSITCFYRKCLLQALEVLQTSEIEFAQMLSSRYRKAWKLSDNASMTQFLS